MQYYCVILSFSYLLCSLFFSCQGKRENLLQSTHKIEYIDPEVAKTLKQYIYQYSDIAPEQRVFALHVYVLAFDSTVFVLEKENIVTNFYMQYPPSFYCIIDTVKVYIYSSLDVMLQGDFKEKPYLLPFAQKDITPIPPTWSLVKYKQQYTLFKKGWYPYLPPFNKPTIYYTPPP